MSMPRAASQFLESVMSLTFDSVSDVAGSSCACSSGARSAGPMKPAQAKAKPARTTRRRGKRERKSESVTARLTFGQGERDRHLHVGVDGPSAPFTRAEFPFAHGGDGGGFKLPLRGARGIGVSHIAVGRNDEVHYDLTGDAGAAHIKGILRDGLKLRDGDLIELGDVKHLNALAEAAVALRDHDGARHGLEALGRRRLDRLHKRIHLHELRDV